ncbi:hypothetical protein Hanom_Chr00s047497g01777921 [Helianthus anomalus]
MNTIGKSNLAKHHYHTNQKAKLHLMIMKWSMTCIMILWRRIRQYRLSRLSSSPCCYA